jgi:hypothetical protein
VDTDFHLDLCTTCHPFSGDTCHPLILHVDQTLTSHNFCIKTLLEEIFALLESYHLDLHIQVVFEENTIKSNFDHF